MFSISGISNINESLGLTLSSLDSLQGFVLSDDHETFRLDSTLRSDYLGLHCSEEVPVKDSVLDSYELDSNAMTCQLWCENSENISGKLCTADGDVFSDDATSSLRACLKGSRSDDGLDIVMTYFLE